MEQKIRISGTAPESIVDGPGLRYTLFTQGCPHRCPGCHNPQTHPFEGGREVTVQSVLDEISKNPLLRGLTLSGGEPFCQARPLAELARRVNALGRDVVAYSGYTFEELLAMEDPAVLDLLRQCRYLIDGPFVLEQRSLLLRFRGSANQRILDVPSSLERGLACPAQL